MMSTALLVAMLWVQSPASDVVWLGSDTTQDATRLTGEVIEFTGERLRLRLPNGREVNYPAARVDHIDTQRSAEQRLADEMLARGEPREALARYTQAFSLERRDWVRREIVAGRVRALFDQHDFVGAAENFLILVRNDPATVHFAAIPLVWWPARLDGSARAAARQWLAAEQPIEALMGASLLLDSGEFAEQAATRLRRLTAQGDERVSWLATAQLWRHEVEQVSPNGLADWQRRIEAAPPTLQAGGWYLLGRARQAQADYERAAIALLKVPILYPEQRNLAALALLAASDSLAQQGDAEQARRLREELLEQYSETATGRQVRARLE